MNMLFHYKRENESVKRLKKLLTSHFSGEVITASDSFFDMDERITNNLDSLKIALFYVSHPEEIEHLVLLKKRLNGTHLVLVMPGSDTESITLTYKLHPLLTCFDDGNYEEIRGLIDRMNNGASFKPPYQGGDGKAFHSIWDQKIIF